MLSNSLMSILHCDIKQNLSIKVRPYQHIIEQSNPFPGQDGCAAPYAPRGTVGLLLLTHVQVADHHIPQMEIAGSALWKSHFIKQILRRSVCVQTHISITGNKTKQIHSSVELR